MRLEFESMSTISLYYNKCLDFLYCPSTFLDQYFFKCLHLNVAYPLKQEIIYRNISCVGLILPVEKNPYGLSTCTLS